MLEVFALATQHAPTLVPWAYRDDVVQNLALECLKALRYGVWDVPAERLDEYVQNRLRYRRTSHRRGRLRSMIRSLEYLTSMTGIEPEWMSLENPIADKELAEFVRRVQGTLPVRWVRAHGLVRTDGMTYAKAAKKLRTTTKHVHNYVTAVQNAFRAALPSIGIVPRKSTRGGHRLRSDAPNAATEMPNASHGGLNALTEWTNASTERETASPGASGSLTDVPNASAVRAEVSIADQNTTAVRTNAFFAHSAVQLVRLVV